MTFISLILKTSCTKNFKYFFLISLCNITYKFISKIVSNLIKKKISVYIIVEQFGFLRNRKTQDAVVITKECIHLIKTKTRGPSVDVGPTQIYDGVYWNFLRMILTNIGLDLGNVN